MNHCSKKVCSEQEAGKNKGDKKDNSQSLNNLTAKEITTSKSVVTNSEFGNASKTIYLLICDSEKPELRILNPKSNIPHDKQTEDLSVPVSISATYDS